MICPVCGTMLLTAERHLTCFLKNPSRFSFLKVSEPKFYKQVSKKARIKSLIENEPENVFEILVDGKRHVYHYSCVQCGNCCKSYVVAIHKDDIKKWTSLGKEEEFLRQIEVDMIALQFKNMAGEEWLRKNNLFSVDLDENRAIDLKFRIHQYRNEFKDELNDISNFLLENHDIMDKISEETLHPNQNQHWFISGITEHQKLIPLSFQVIRDGITKGISYILKRNKYRKCPFIENNLCSIHAYKPVGCAAFPRPDAIPRDFDNLLKSCKGLRRLI